MFLALFAQLFFFSCSDTKTVSVDLVAFDKLEPSEGDKFPTFVQELVMPIEGICKDKHPLGFSPILIKRKDLGFDYEVKYLTNKASDNNKVKAIKRQLVNFFKEVAPRFHTIKAGSEPIRF